MVANPVDVRDPSLLVAGARPLAPLASLSSDLELRWREWLASDEVRRSVVIFGAALGAGIGARYWGEGGAAIGAVLGVALARTILESTSGHSEA